MSDKIKIAIASDHAGFELKSALKTYAAGRVEWIDLGAHSAESVDYPDYAQALARAIGKGDAATGVLICGSGVGISIAANRFPHIRAALCTDETMARLSRKHNDANVLVLGARIIGLEVAHACLDAFLLAEFEGGRHQRRVDKLAVTC